MTLVTTPPADFERDQGHLRTLSIFWYILSGVQALAGCIVLGYIGLAILLGLGITSSGQQGDAQAGIAFGGFLACIGLFVLAIWWGLALLNFIVARSLPRHKHRALCFVMSALLCPMLPLGTILGVFTLVVLSRPSVKAAAV